MVTELGKQIFAFVVLEMEKLGGFFCLFCFVFLCHAVLPQNVMFFAPDTRSTAQRRERQTGQPLSGTTARRDR